AADARDRDVAVAEDHAGQGLDLEVAHRLLLLLREVAHLALRELDVLEGALADLRDRLCDLRVRQAGALRLPVVELFRQLAGGRAAACLDAGEDGFARLAPLGVGRLDGARVHSAFEPAGHGNLLFRRKGRADWQCDAFARPASTQRMPPRGSATSPV